MFDTLDLAPHLRAGPNLLAAVVWNHGEYNPFSQMSRRTAFVLQGGGPGEAAADTGPGWKVAEDPSVTVADTTRRAGIPTGYPEGVTGVFVWEGKEIPLKPGRQKLEW